MTIQCAVTWPEEHDAYEPSGDVRADCQGCHWFALGRWFEAEEVKYRAEEHARATGHTVAMTGIEQEVLGIDATQITPGV